MIYYDRIAVSEIVHVNKRGESKECDICHYWCFLNKGLEFQPYVCSRSLQLVMMSMNLSDISILKTTSPDHCFISSKISKKLSPKLAKNYLLNFMHNAGITQKNCCKNIKKISLHKKLLKK